jgi:hypothetical protein
VQRSVQLRQGLVAHNAGAAAPSVGDLQEEDLCVFLFVACSEKINK